VVFSAAALETFINELSEIPRGMESYFDKERPDLPSPGPPAPSLVSFAAIMEDLDNSRASLESKFLFARLILGGTTFDKGRQPYQDFKLLIDLRNEIVHGGSDKVQLNPETGQVRWQNSSRVMRGLESRGLVQKASIQNSWLATISSPAVAHWACNAAAAMAQSILEVVPEDNPTGYFLRKVYGELFRPLA
jgi:hypothetical protein